MFYIAIPSLVTVMIGPLAVKLNALTYQWLFEEHTPTLDFNEGLSVYLIPASLIYAMVYGFALQEATSRFDNIVDNSGKIHRIN